MAIASYLQNYRARTTPPRVASTSRQRTTRGGPVVVRRTPQPTTGTGKIVRPPVNPFVSMGTLAGMKTPAASTAAPAPAAASAPPAPMTFANVNPAQLPVDPTYDATVAALTKQRDDTILGLQGQRTQGLQDYGFTETPGGGVAFDPSSAYSRAALLRKTYLEGKEGTQTGMAARGQLYAGVLQTAQAANDSNFNANENSLERALIGFLTNNQGAQNRARTGFESSVAQALSDRVGRAQQDLANNPPVVPDAAPAPPAAGAAVTPATAASLVAAMRRRQQLTGARIGRI